MYKWFFVAKIIIEMCKTVNYIAIDPIQICLIYRIGDDKLPKRIRNQNKHKQKRSEELEPNSNDVKKKQLKTD